MATSPTSTPAPTEEPLDHNRLKKNLKSKGRRGTLPPAQPIIQTSLMDLARMQQWSALLSRVNRKEARMVDAHGLYPLHWACSGGPPLTVVEALLDTYPRSVRKMDQEGSTALHFACHYGAGASVVDRLIQAYPEATTKQDKFGRTALFHAVSKSASLEILQSLVEENPAAITTSCFAPEGSVTTTGDNATSGSTWACQTPLFLSWVAVLRDRQTTRRNITTSKVWMKAQFLLQIAYTRYLDLSDGTRDLKSLPTREFQFLPSVIAMLSFLPPPVLELGVQIFPEQIRERDPRKGQLPLAMAAATKIDPKVSDYAIRVLLDSYPEAATALDGQEQSTLALAVASGKRWDQGVERLFQAAPDMLRHPDSRTGLPPALIAAASATIENDTKGDGHHQLYPCSAEADVDPFGLLLVTRRTSSRKQDAIADWGHMSDLSVSSSSGSGKDNYDAEVEDEGETKRLSTIYQLLSMDPSAVKV